MKTIQGLEHKKFFNQCINARAGILTNQSAFGYQGQYHYQYYRQFMDLKVVFIPEHGLFAELQDQVSGSALDYNEEGLAFVNLYGDNEQSLFPDPSILDQIDLLLIDIRDTGARYYTFLTTCFYLLQAVSRHNKSRKKIEVIIIDSPNPAGRKVEGSPLAKKYESFVGVPSVLHRHGLTPAELLNYYNVTFSLALDMHSVLIGEIYMPETVESLWIPPSPNIPNRSTCLVYAGQCLLEGTNVSEGRGTTRPFEIFGANYIEFNNEKLLRELYSHQQDAFILRPLRFIPTFHKYQNEICGGFQIMIKNQESFHSLLFTLHAVKTIRSFYPDLFAYNEGVYEFRSDYTAIQILAGDDMILDFLDGKISYKEISDYFTEEENQWKNKITPFLLYP